MKCPTCGSLMVPTAAVPSKLDSATILTLKDLTLTAQRCERCGEHKLNDLAMARMNWSTDTASRRRKKLVQ